MNKPIKRGMRREVGLGKPLVRRELVARGFRGNTLSEMAARGVVYRVAQGVYAPTMGTDSALFDYELAAKAVPKGVFTLVSALRLHGLTDENPLRMTMAIPLKGHPPKTTLPIDFVYMTPSLLDADVDVCGSPGEAYRVFTLERTIAECFKARNKIGIGIAVAALREAVSRGRLNMNRFADVLGRCRMLRIVRPYMEGVA